MLTIVAKIHAKKGMEQHVYDELKKLIEPTRSEKGCIQYDLHQSIEDPTIFIFYENWETKPLWEAHMESKDVKKWRASSGDTVESFELYQLQKK
ncbi:antibiotic biosynthesis monooxygenase [Hazenella sp. IB182353]|uniref:putative quinol monooxygenase n=1 Tax=Polycladospora coralii TaxID=2771432 RepID=UPI00174724B1|nr:putative quinol monooxygenase [Polycladospora coralii]MBS7531263.1 antibiotic biosynthesis monooxygenase [Polycladospora coralii]